MLSYYFYAAKLLGATLGSLEGYRDMALVDSESVRAERNLNIHLVHPSVVLRKQRPSESRHLPKGTQRQNQN